MLTLNIGQLFVCLSVPTCAQLPLHVSAGQEAHTHALHTSSLSLCWLLLSISTVLKGSWLSFALSRSLSRFWEHVWRTDFFFNWWGRVGEAG